MYSYAHSMLSAFLPDNRRTSRQRTLAIFLLAFALLASLAPALPARAATVINEVALAPSSGPVGVASPDNFVWFAESSANRIGAYNPTGDHFEFTIPTPNSQPYAMATGADGNAWFTEVNGNQIGRITVSGAVTEFKIPTPNGAPEGIASGSDGALWFTEFVGNKIGRLTTSGVFTEFPLPTPNSQPRAITPGLDGALWFVAQGANKIGRITTAGLIREFPVPATSPSGIVAGPDNALWFGDRQDHAIGRLSILGVLSKFPLPSGDVPQVIAVGPDHALWFGETTGPGSDSIGRLTTAGALTEFAIPTNSANPGGIVLGPDGNVWFSESTPSKLAQVVVSFTTLALGITANVLGPEAGIRLVVKKQPQVSGGLIAFQYHDSSFTVRTAHFEHLYYTNVNTPLALAVFSGHLSQVQGNLFRSGDSFTVSLSNIGSVPHAVVVVRRGRQVVVQSVQGPGAPPLAGSFVQITKRA